MRQAVIAAGIALGIGAGAVRAQEPMHNRVVNGVVFDSVGQRPLGGAVLYFQGRRDEIRTESDGRFHLAEVRPEDSVLVVRRIGYVPVRVSIAPDPATVAVDLGLVRMRPVATRLDRIAVEAEEVERFPLLAGFYRRKQAGRVGFFATREEIDRTGARKVSEVLARAPRIEMDCPQATLGDDRCTTRSRRARNIIRVPAPPQGGRRTPVPLSTVDEADTAEYDLNLDRCEMETWVDGIRTSLKVDEIPLNSIAGIEVYNGLATTPPEFGAGRCGVVAIWTVKPGRNQ